MTNIVYLRDSAAEFAEMTMQNEETELVSVRESSEIVDSSFPIRFEVNLTSERKFTIETKQKLSSN